MGGNEDMLDFRIGPRGIQIGFEPVVQCVADVGISEREGRLSDLIANPAVHGLIIEINRTAVGF